MEKNIQVALYAGTNMMVAVTSDGYQTDLAEATLKSLIDDEITEWREIEGNKEKGYYLNYLRLASKALRDLADHIDKEIS